MKKILVKFLARVYAMTMFVIVGFVTFVIFMPVGGQVQK